MAQINLRIDDDVKRNYEQVRADIGLSLSTAINIYLKKLGREKRIPFEVTADPFYSDENMARLREAIRSVETGKSTLKEHDLIEVDG